MEFTSLDLQGHRLLDVAITLAEPVAPCAVVPGDEMATTRVDMKTIREAVKLVATK